MDMSTFLAMSCSLPYVTTTRNLCQSFEAFRVFSVLVPRIDSADDVTAQVITPVNVLTRSFDPQIID